jgi:hypothetical protein
MERDQNNGSEYVVRFNRKPGRTLLYEDPLGSLLFVFDVGDAPTSIVLDRRPLENQKVLVVKDEPTRARVTLAFERVKAFLLSKRYEVTES